MSVVDDCRLDLTVSVPWETVKKYRDDIIAGSVEKAKIPGFRLGKVPTAVFARHFEREILDAMKEDFAPYHVIEEAKRKDRTFAYGPEIRDMRLVEGECLEIDATLEVFPRFELGEYRNIEVSVPENLPIDQVVDVRLNDLRTEQGSFANVDPRAAREEDHVLVSIEITKEDGETVLELSDQVVDLENRNDLPSGFRESILGMSPGEESEFRYVCPENLFARKIAGQTLLCKIQLHQVGQFEVAELDDEFAQDVSDEFKTLDDLRARVRAEADQAIKARIEEDVRQQVLDALAAAHPMPLPKRYLEHRVGMSLETVRSRMAWEEAGQQVQIDNLAYLTRELDPQLTEEQLVLVRDETTAIVRGEQVLDRIARLENISVSLEELEQQVRAIAEAHKVSRDELARHLVNSGEIRAVQDELLRTKILEYVVGEAIRVPKDSGTDSEDSDGREESAPS